MDYFNHILTTFLGIERTVVVPLLFMEGLIYNFCS